MDAPRRVQNQVNESFGFEVSLDAVVLFDVRDQCRDTERGRVVTNLAQLLEVGSLHGLERLASRDRSHRRQASG